MSLDEAERVLRAGGLVVYPTDTLWALGARVLDPAAVRRVFEAKQRPLDQPLSMAVADVGSIEAYAVLTPLARRLARLLPGSLTLVLERRPTVPDVLTAGGPTVGLRVPDHPQALALLRRAGPLTATSANRHGRPDPATLDEAMEQFGDRAGYYLRAESPPLGVASTLVDARGDRPRILRPGAVGEDDIRGCLRD